MTMVGMTIPTLLWTTQCVFTRDCASLTLSWSILYGELPSAILMVSSQLACQWDMCMRRWFRDKQSERGWQGGGLATQWHLLAMVQAVTLFTDIHVCRVWIQWADSVIFIFQLLVSCFSYYWTTPCWNGCFQWKQPFQQDLSTPLHSLQRVCWDHCKLLWGLLLVLTSVK